VQLHAGMALEPGTHHRMRVGGQVVDHHVQLAARIGTGDLAQEGQELLMAVPLGAGLGDLAGGHLQRGEQRGGAVPDVVRAGGLRMPGPHRQRRGGPLQGLDLGLLVDAKHHRLRRRMQIQPDDVADLGLQLRVGGERERLRPPRLDPEAVPDPGDGGVRDRRALPGQRRSQQPGGPVRRPELHRRLGQGQLQHPIAQRLRQLGRLARPRQILQPGQAVLGIAAAPGHHRSLGATDQRGDLLTRHSVRGQQHDPGAFDLASRRTLVPSSPLSSRRSVSGTFTVRTCAAMRNGPPAPGMT
jgi:hypothetical protein